MAADVDLEAASPLAKLEAEHDSRQAHDHLSRDCPWYQHVSKGGRDDVEMHCRPAPHEGAVPKLVVKLTPHTAEASTVPKPTVPPGGPGLFRIKGRELPPYVQHLWHHLAPKYGKEKAYGMAVGIVKKWKAGINPGGKHPGHVHADVQAAAAKNVAEWEKDKADAHAQSREHEERRAAATAVGLAMATAPGARPFFTPPTPGGSYQQYGLHQHPVQSISPSPPLPPDVKMPTAAEVRAVASLVPECSDKSLSDTALKFIDQAAGKIERGNPLEALSVMRGAQAALFSAHKADMRELIPTAYTANVFTQVPPAEQSSASNAIKQGREKILAWRKAELALNALVERIRKKYFHGIYNGPSQLGRFTTEDGMTSLDKVLALAGIVTGKDVSFPTESDTTGQAPQIKPPDNLLRINDPDALRELASMPALDQMRVKTYLDSAHGMLNTNRSNAAQFAMHAIEIAKNYGLEHLIRIISYHIQAIADMSNMTNIAGDVASKMWAGEKAVNPENRPQQVEESGNGKATLSASLRSGVRLASGFGSPGAAQRIGRQEGIPVRVAPAAKPASSSSGSSGSSGSPSSSSPGPSSTPVIRTRRPPAGEPGPAHRPGGGSAGGDLHQMHVAHLEHLHHLHVLHEQHMAHMHHLAAMHAGRG